MDPRYGRGREGEALAAKFLEGRGWEVLARNWRAGHKELDLVVRRGTTVAFVEVKTRRGAQCGHPFEAITLRKRREIEAAARVWLRTEGARLGQWVGLRFDAVAVRMTPGTEPELEHLPDAWRPGGPG